MIEIETRHLKMRQIQKMDWPLFKRLHTELGVISFCFEQPELDELKETFLTRITPWTAGSGTWLSLVIVDKTSTESVGITGFIIKDNVAEVGYLLLPEFHGQQFATESLAALLEWGTATHQLTSYKAVVTEGNIASERVLLKCGFQLASVVSDAFEIGGKMYADHVYYLSQET